MSDAPANLGIVALPFEVSTSFRKGTSQGPEAILEEFDRLDHFDFRLGRDPFRGVPRTIVKPHGPEIIDPRIEQAVAGRVAGELLDNGGFPISLGGEHTVSLGPVRAARTRGELGVVQLDAHSDLRDAYEGNPLSHACVMRRVLDMDCRTLGLGIRSMCREEADLIARRGLDVVPAREITAGRDWWRLVDGLPERVYLTVDLDYFDPADVPAVGTPEPGGPAWDETLAFLEHLFSTKNVVAADIVELMPGPGDESSLRLAVRLLGFITGLRFPRAG